MAAIPPYVERYYGFWLIALALVGWLAGRGRPRDPLRALAAGWIVASAFFFVLGHISSLDIRYYLGAYPALAIVGAQAQSGRWATRTAGALLLSYGGISAVVYWLAWLGAWP